MTIYYLSIKKIHKFSLKCPKILYINLTGLNCCVWSGIR